MRATIEAAATTDEELIFAAIKYQKGISKVKNGIWSEKKRKTGSLFSYTSHQGDYGRTYSQTRYQSLQVQQLKSEGSAIMNMMLYLFHFRPSDSESHN